MGYLQPANPFTVELDYPEKNLFRHLEKEYEFWIVQYVQNNQDFSFKKDIRN